MKETKTEALTLTKAELKDLLSSVLEASQGVPQAANKPAISDNSLELEINRRIREGEAFNMRLSRDPRRVTLTIDKLYVPYTGKSVTSTVNGSTVKVPVDGRPYEVHPAHYAAIREYLMYISEQIERNSGNEDLLGIDQGDVAKIN